MKLQVEVEVDEPSTHRRLRSVPPPPPAPPPPPPPPAPPPPLRTLTRRLDAFCAIASTHFYESF